MALTDRHVPLTACFNFRDLGGLETADGRRVRSGVLFRADTLHRLTPEDLDVLRGMGLRTVIDLRTPDELDRHGRIPLADHDEVVHHHLPMVDELRTDDAVPDESAPSAEVRGDMYVRLVEQGGGAVVKALELLVADGALPAVFHCTAGKDRTGVLAALVLGQLGVPDAAIAEDYALTELSLPDTMAWIEANDPERAAAFASYPKWVWEAPAAIMLAFLEQVREAHGSVPELLLSLGADRATLDALAGALLEG
jgi:protein-tyrosine phosphatase